MWLLLLAACVGLTQVPEKQQWDPEGTDTSGGDDTSTPITAGALVVSTDSIAFGDVLIDTEASEPLTLHNDGDETLRVAVVQSGSDRFSVDTTAISLDAGQDQVVTVSFGPDMDSSFTGELELSVDSGDAATVSLSGQGVTEGGGTDTDTGSSSSAGDIDPAKTSMDFGDVDLHDTFAVSMSVSNTGGADLTVSSVTSSDPAFVVVGDFATSRTLAPGTSKTLQVEFTPTAATSYSASLSLHSDDPDEPTTNIALTGRGLDACDICSPVIEVDTGGDPYSMEDFFSFMGGADTRSVQVRNAGDEDLVVSNVVLSNDIFATCGTFTLAGWSGSTTLAPGDSTAFSVSFAVTEAGLCIDPANPSLGMNIIDITSNDPGQPVYEITLGGTGAL